MGVREENVVVHEEIPKEPWQQKKKCQEIKESPDVLP